MFFLCQYDVKGKEIENHINISITKFLTPQNEKFIYRRHRMKKTKEQKKMSKITIQFLLNMFLPVQSIAQGHRLPLGTKCSLCRG